MKRVEVVVEPGGLARVKKRLEAAGSPGMTVGEVLGPAPGEQPGQHRLTTVAADLRPRIQLSVVVEDDVIAATVNAIAAAARSERSGNGDIVITPVEDVVRIRTGERGSAAL